MTRSSVEAAFSEYQSRVGDTIAEKAFISTSKSSEASREGQIRYVIKSKHGKDISRMSLKGTAEEEVLFRSGTTFKVKSAVTIKDGREYLVELEEV